MTHTSFSWHQNSIYMRSELLQTSDQAIVVNLTSKLPVSVPDET